jgi:glycine/D-amino acid oxidase-like deaminating enzyme
MCRHETLRVRDRMTKYGRSPWIDQFPKSRVRSYPRYRGASQRDVVIVGAGLTGCTTAYAFAAAGINVTLLDADRIGHGSTGGAAGWIADEPGVDFLDLEKTFGRRAAKQAWQAWRRAALDFSALLRRLDLKCQFDPQATVTVAITPEQAARLKREQKARREAGVDAALLNARAVASESALVAFAALRTKDGATLDPYRASAGVAAAAVQRGAEIFEQSPVTKIAFNRKTAEVITTGGTIRAGAVVIATGVPTALCASLARHFWFRSAYLALTEPVSAKVRQRLGRRAAVIRDAADPPHLVRWVNDDRLLVCGADAESPAPKRREHLLVQRTGQLMYELSTMYPDISGIQPAYGWDAAYARSGDGLPHIGPHRNFPHHLFAFGDGGHGMTSAYLASRILLRHVLNKPEAADETFGFARTTAR